MYTNIDALEKECLEKGRATQEIIFFNNHHDPVIDVEPKVISNSLLTLPVTTNNDKQTSCFHRKCHPTHSTRNTIHNLAHLVKMWVHDTKNHKAKKDKKGLNICDNAPLSESFIQRFASTRDEIPLNEDAKIAIYAGFLEAEAFNHTHQRNNHRLQELLSFQEGVQRVSYSLMHNTIKWQIRYNAKYQFGFVRLVQVIFNISWLDALATLGNILNIPFKNIFSVHNVTHAAEHNAVSHATDETIKYLDFTLDGTVKYVSQSKLMPILGHSGQTIGAIACYEINSGKTFALPVAVAQGKLSIGKNKATALFFNQTEMDANPTAIVILSLNIHLAFDLDDYFERQEGVVVAGHYGHDLSPLPWNFFHNRRVILLCPPNIDYYAMVNEYHTYLTEAKVKEVLIFPFPLLFQEDKHTLDRIDFTPLEAELSANTLDLTKESSSHVLRYIYKKAMPYKEYEKWGVELGLFVPRNTPTVNHSNIPTFTCGLDTEYSPQTYADINLDHILPTKGVSLIYGRKNVGKSYVVLGLIKAFTQNRDFGGIKKHLLPTLLFLWTQRPYLATLHLDSDNLTLRRIKICTA